MTKASPTTQFASASRSGVSLGYVRAIRHQAARRQPPPPTLQTVVLTRQETPEHPPAPAQGLLTAPHAFNTHTPSQLHTVVGPTSQVGTPQNSWDPSRSSWQVPQAGESPPAQRTPPTPHPPNTFSTRGGPGEARSTERQDQTTPSWRAGSVAQFRGLTQVTLSAERTSTPRSPFGTHPTLPLPTSWKASQSSRSFTESAGASPRTRSSLDIWELQPTRERSGERAAENP